MTVGLTLDAGALIAFEKGQRRVHQLLSLALADGQMVAVPAGVVGQVWRGGQRQVRVAMLLATAGIEIVPLDDAGARAAGRLCGATRTRDVIDASVVLCAKARVHTILTSDVEELRALDAAVRIVRV